MTDHNSQFTIHNSQLSNPAILAAKALVNSLVASGLRHVCIAPGSRSTPLTLAFADQPEVTVHVHLDERSAGFMALGLAMKTGRPVALVCTSGTAAANFYPAVIEAFMSQVPLIVLTADRPPELRHSGANQTIDQVKMYGDHVLWAADLGVPTPSMPDVALRNVATTAARAYRVASGIRRGPVHVNLPFRKPLEPSEDNRLQTTDHRGDEPGRKSTSWGENSGLKRRQTTDHRPQTTDHSWDESGRESTSWGENSGLRTQDLGVKGIQELGRLMPTEGQVAALVGLIERYPHGLIVCGPGGPGGDFPEAVAALARATGYPIAADPLSNLRFGPWVDDTPLWTTYETTLAGGRMPAWPAPEVVIRFGGVPTSKWLNQYLDTIEPAVRLHVRHKGVWADDSHRTTDFWQVDEALLCEMVVQETSVGKMQTSPKTRDERLAARRSPDRAPNSLSSNEQQLTTDVEDGVWETIETFMDAHNFDGAAVHRLFELLPEGSNVMIGNSLPIRHADQFARPAGRRLKLFGNRGASGIDGIISTAVGIAKTNTAEQTVLIIGDVSFFHDQNGLLPVPSLPNLLIVLLHNDGGSIFRRLPVSKIDPPFARLFLTPHGLDFAHVCALHRLTYASSGTITDFVAAVEQALASNKPGVVAYYSDGAVDEQLRQKLIAEVNHGE